MQNSGNSENLERGRGCQRSGVEWDDTTDGMSDMPLTHDESISEILHSLIFYSLAIYQANRDQTTDS